MKKLEVLWTGSYCSQNGFDDRGDASGANGDRLLRRRSFDHNTKRVVRHERD